MANNADKLGQNNKTAASFFSQFIKLSLFSGLTGLLLYGLLSLVQPQYRSLAQLKVEQPGSNSKTLVAQQIKILSDTELQSTIIENFKLVNDPEFNGVLGRKGPLKRVLILLGVINDPAKLPVNDRVRQAFNQRVKIHKGQKSGAIKIAVRSDNAAKSARIANRYATAYIAGLTARPRTQKQGQRKSPELALISNLRSEIAISQTKLNNLRQDIVANPFSPPAPLNEINENPLMVQAAPQNIELSEKQRFELNSKYILARADREEAELRAKLVREMLDESGELHSTSKVLNTGLIETLLIKRSIMERTMADLEVTLLPSHPHLQRLNREMSALRSQIKNEALKAVANLETEAAIAAVREKSLKQSIDQLQAIPDASDVVVKSADSLAKREPTTAVDIRVGKLQTLQTLIAKNKSQLMAAQARLRAERSEPLEKNGAPITASLISKAVAVSVPVFPKKIPITLLGMLAAFGLGLVMLVMSSRSSAKEQEDVNEGLSGQKEQPVDEDFQELSKSAMFDTELEKPLGASKVPELLPAS